MSSKKIIIALDGHSACGKSTLAKAMARELSYVYVDSGAMYRAVTYYAIQNNLVKNNEIISAELIDKLADLNVSFNYSKNTGRSETFLNGICIEDEIRTLTVSRLVSKVAVIKEVRDKLVEFQQRLGKTKGIVMDGRDIGTTVFPHAELKIWVTASVKVRAARRYKELVEMGSEVTLAEVEENVLERDKIDSSRAESPLRRAEDAIDIDNSLLSKEETLSKAMFLANEILAE